MEQRRIMVQWSVPARDALAKLDKNVRRIILDRVASLADCDDPRRAYNAKLLRAPGILAGYYRLRVSRYRIIYAVSEEELANGDVFCLVKVTVVHVGMRKAGDKKDVYKLAEKLLRLSDRMIEAEETTDENDQTQSE